MEEKILYYKIPSLDVKKGSNSGVLNIIGIIDSSGSMSSWWSWIADFWNSDVIPKERLHTITFDTKPRVIESNVLSTKIKDHGGGGTSIPEAFVQFEKILNSIPQNESITAIFISDGQDSNSYSLETRMKILKGNVEDRKVNFICMGIQSGFPTFLSMGLRQLYHRGDENIPALYLIEYASEKAFFNKFEGMRSYFYSAGSVQLDPPVLLYPWDESIIDCAYEGSWVISKSDQISLNSGEPIHIQEVQLSVEDAVDIFRGWVQKLQMLALIEPANARKGAVIAVDEMTRVIAQLNKRYGVEDVRLITEDLILKTPQFGLRSKYNYIWRYGSKLDWFFTEIDNLAKGVTPHQTSEFEAAKRMNIGTITGKHQQKVLALKNITLAEFEKMKLEFANLLNSVRSKAPHITRETGGNEGSLTELFANVDDFLLGLEYCKNQYDLFETIPFSGIACKVKRSEGYQENYRQVDFKQIFFGTYVDITSLTNAASQWSVPMTIKEEKVELNCFLPLFRKEDSEFLRPLVRSRLVKFMMTFLLTTNYDLIEDNSYLSSLASCLILIFQKQYDAIRDIISSQILQSLEVFYDQDKHFQAIQESLITDPNAVFSEHKDKLDLLYLHIFYAQKTSRIDDDHLLTLITKLKIIYFHAAVTKNGLTSVVKPDFDSIGLEAIVEQLKQTVSSFFSLADFRKGFIPSFIEVAKKVASEKLHLSKKLLTDPDICKLPLQLILALLPQTKVPQMKQENEVSEMEGGIQDKDMEEFIFLASHASKYSLSDAFSNPIDHNLNAIKEQVVSQVDEASIKKIKGFSNLFSTMEEHYVKQFVEQHWNVQPITKDELINYCHEKKVIYDTLQMDEASLLCKNACLSPKCPFFLHTCEKFNRHLGGWQGKLPLGFHRFIKARSNLTVDKLYAQAVTKWKGFPEKFSVTPEFARDYITKIFASYSK